MSWTNEAGAMMLHVCAARSEGLQSAAGELAPRGARFDDLLRGTALRFHAPEEFVVAWRPEDVVDVIEAAERATGEGRWAWGFLSYEAAPGLRRELVTASPGQPGIPLAWFGIGGPPEKGEALRLRSGEYTAEPWRADWSSQEYTERIERIRAEIAAGSTYQCNLADRLRSVVSGDLEAFYADLALRQRGAHNALLDLGSFALVSASPELFFERVGSGLTTRPMKGTAPRGRFTEEDEVHRRVLLGSAKERAENVMVVDLLRNDLGRIALPGTVRVPQLCRAERFETVWQLTSDVTAKLRPNVGLAEIFAALFPCGSVTGAPKASTMRLIAELEVQPRGVYCGAIGYLAPDSAPVQAHFAVPIRTATVQRATGIASYGSGGGITWDSTAADEHAELLVKARILDDRYEEFDLLETMAYEPGAGIRNVAGHLSRLADSAAYFGFAFDFRAVHRCLEAETAGARASRVRLLLGRDGRCRVELGALPAPDDGPVRVVIDDLPIDADQPWFFHKTTRRAAYQSRARRHADADDVLLVNQSGEVTESTIANLAVELDGAWYTPPVSSGCLPGVERARLVAEQRLTEREVSVAEVRGATRLALVSSLRGWRPAELLH